MPWIILGTALSYIIGSIPTAYIFGRLLKGIDIRSHGSGNVGATNVLRVLGKGPALVVLGLDMFKGLASAVFVADSLSLKIPSADILVLRLLFGISSILGHNWTIFLNFKGGKGVATTAGVMLALAIKIPSLRLIFVILLLAWLIVFLLTRIVSLASVITALLMPVSMIVFKQRLILTGAGLAISLFILLRHRSNLKRLFQGKEQRIRFKT